LIFFSGFVIKEFYKNVKQKLNNMESTKFTVSEYFRQVTIVHFALLVGVLMFISISVLLSATEIFTPLEKDIQTLAIIACVALFLGGMVLIFFISKAKLKYLNNNVQGIYEKMTQYKAVLILRAAIIEMIAFGVTLVFLLTGTQIILGVAVFCFIVLVFVRPTKDRLIRELQLEKSEIDIIHDPDAEILQ